MVVSSVSSVVLPSDMYEYVTVEWLLSDVASFEPESLLLSSAGSDVFLSIAVTTTSSIFASLYV